MIKVLKPGLNTTIQDEGRIGFYEIGMPPSGALDSYSYSVANYLVGNQQGAACLEMTYTGASLEFDDSYLISITGANMTPKLNSEDVPMWTTLRVSPGDKLTFSFGKDGARTYLAISGGIDVPKVLNSRSTYVLSGIGGHEGRKLIQGDELRVGKESKNSIKEGTTIPEEYRLNIQARKEIRIIDGMFSYRITDQSKEILTEAIWKITPDSNRVGYRIQGGVLEFIDRIQPFGAGSSLSNVVEAGYPIGCIQVPDGAEPIILLKDAVTCGGYPTVATVISTDLNILGQLKVNDDIKFKYVTIEEALQIRRSFLTTLKDVESLINKK